MVPLDVGLIPYILVPVGCRPHGTSVVVPFVVFRTLLLDVLGGWGATYDSICVVDSNRLGFCVLNIEGQLDETCPTSMRFLLLTKSLIS